MSYVNHESLPYLVEKLADANNIKIAGNPNGTRVGAVVDKIVEKTDDITKVVDQELINDGYSFKVGTGDVDVNSSVEDGFSEIGIKGNTYQNLGLGLDLSKYSLVSKNVTVSNGYFSMVGDGTSHITLRTPPLNLLTSKKYTLIMDISKNTLSEQFHCIMDNGSSQFENAPVVAKDSKGVVRLLLNTRSSFTDKTKGLEFRIWYTTTGEISFKYMLIEGDHTNNPNLPSYFEGIQGVGDKSKNLFNGEVELGSVHNNGQNIDSDTIQRPKDFIKCNPNTNYTFSMVNIKYVVLHCYDENKVFIKYFAIGAYSTYKFETPSNCHYLKFRFEGLDSVLIQIEEGSIATQYESYYEGHKIEILSEGKNSLSPNMFQVTGCKNYEIYNDSSIRMTGDTTGYWARDYFTATYNIKGGKDYWFYFDSKDKLENAQCEGWYNDKNVAGLSNGRMSKRNYTEDGVFSMKFFPNAKAGKYNYEKVNFAAFQEPTTSYEPYISDKTQILLDEPLMKLPNGVCDEIKDGKLIRRVGKMILDGNHMIGMYPIIEEFSVIGFYVSNRSHRDIKTGYCDKLPINPTEVDIFPGRVTEDKEQVVIRDLHIKLSISKNKLSSVDLQGVQNYLRENPITVYFGLETQIVTNLQQPVARIFKDGHLTFNTLVAPTSTHKVLLNKSAQIENSVREVQSLDSRVGKLESFYDDMILETSHKLSLLDLDFDYVRESEEV